MKNNQILQKYYNVLNIRELKRKLPFLQDFSAKQIYQQIKFALPQIQQNYAVNENKTHLAKVENIKHMRKINAFKEKIANKKIGSF